MWIDKSKILQKILRPLKLSPLPLAKKCGIMFGSAVILVLILSLMVTYIWMGQLANQASLDAGRAKSEVLLRRHFRSDSAGESSLAPLDNSGKMADVNNLEMQWIRFEKDYKKNVQSLSEELQKMLKYLQDSENRDDTISLREKDDVTYSNYTRLFRANDRCISCHNPQGTAGAFAKNEPIGAVIIQRPIGEIGKLVSLNRFWIIASGVIGGIAAVVAFYMIIQRIILRPIRQLRALANNVADGNLDTRSSIKTDDEFQKLSDAFNHMLDGLQATQEKLRQANKQLDAKIAELSDRNIELFKANKIKSEFLANISHEFRTPLNAILGFAEILHDKGDVLKTDKGRKYTENIINGGKRLLNMVNDLLALAKTEAGKMKLNIEKTSIAQICKSSLASFSEMTRKKKIKVKTSINDNIPDLMTDAGKVQQILYNFISNAVKFTPEQGRIELTASMPDDKTVRLAVLDTGCGIAESDKEKLFEKFRQIDGSMTRFTDGSGLGLAISRELALLLAGSVGFESEIGKGSTFWLDLPVVNREENQKEEKQPL